MAKTLLILLVPLIALAAVLIVTPDNQEGLPNWRVFNGAVRLTAVLDKIKNVLTPPPNKIFELTTAYWKSSVLRSFAVLRVADAFRLSKQKEMTCPEIIDQLGRLDPPFKTIHAPFFCRLLRAAAAEGFLSVNSKHVSLDHLLGNEKNAPPTPKFSLTELGFLLDSENPEGTYNFVVALTGNSLKAWSAMSESMQTGNGGFLQAFGEELWEYEMKNDPKELELFNEAMRELSLQLSKVARADYNFSTCSHVCDIGGGVGTVAIELIRNNPQAKATILDLPFAEKNALEYFESQGVKDRVKFVGGSFFNKEDIPSECDCYVMKHILHDWPDKECKQILSNIAPVLSSTDRVILIESVIGSSDLEPIEEVKLLMDLNMLASCPSGAQERTEAEFRALFDHAGLDLVSVTNTKSFVSVVEARPRK